MAKYGLFLEGPTTADGAGGWSSYSNNLSGQVGGHGAAQANETNKYPSFDQNSWTQQAGHDKRRSDAGHDN